LEGTKVKGGYNSAFLQRHGAAPGSSIAMTPTAFMTDKGSEFDPGDERDKIPTEKQKYINF
jgi:hypothetical protein